MKALTVRQPWAWAIFNAGKDLENRVWKLPDKYRGEVVAIHAAKGLTKKEWSNSSIFMASQCHVEVPDFYDEQLVRSAIIGTVRLVDCVRVSFSPWFEGPFGWQLAEVKKFENPISCKGFLGFWEAPL